jgi:SAM-dependent methyltransferase
MTKGERFEEYFSIVRRHGLWSGRKASLKFYLDYIFEGVSFKGMAMLDVGSGFGLFSLYGAYMGAKPVICLEPELGGSREGVAHKLRKLLDSLPSHIDVIPKAITFQEFEPDNQIFDIILLHNSINHLDEEACINLQHSDDAKKRYKVIFEKLGELASPRAKLIISDCSRYNFWHQIRLRNPVVPTIEWRKHQRPEYWSNLLNAVGFANPHIRWTSPARFGKVGRLLFGNWLASYLTTSHFRLVMDKC